MTRSSQMTPANIVTIVRIVLIPVFLVLMLADWPDWFSVPPEVASLKPWIAAAVFALLAITDGVDGYLARSRNEVTTFGQLIDPIADKLLVTAALLALIELDVLPAWIALVIISREFIVSGLRMVASAEGRVISASWYGKAKTVFQIVAIITFIVKDSAAVGALPPDTQAWIQAASWFVMGVAVVLTIISMLDYFYHARDVLIGPWLGETIVSAPEVAEARAVLDERSEEETEETLP